MVTAAYLLSFLPVYWVLRQDLNFSLRSSFFWLNWLGVSLSVHVSGVLGLPLVELGLEAEENLAASILNLAIAWTVWIARGTYRGATIVFARRHKATGKGTSKVTGETLGFYLLIGATMLVSLFSLLPAPPILTGTPVSEFFRSISSVERFAFTSIAISAVPISRWAFDLRSARRITPLSALALSALPALTWVAAGEKFGYFLFIVFLAATPWFQVLVADRRTLKMGAAFVAVAFALTLLNYALTTENPWLFLAARLAMQGQLWHYFYETAGSTPAFPENYNVLLGGPEGDTLTQLMALSMPTSTFLDYETALLSGSHFPALLHAGGWLAFPLLVTCYGAVFGLVVSALRVAAESSSRLFSYLLVGVFVFPAIEVFVSGNAARLFTLPPTYLAFLVVLLPLAFSNLRIRIPSHKTPLTFDRHAHR